MGCSPQWTENLEILAGYLEPETLRCPPKTVFGSKARCAKSQAAGNPRPPRGIEKHEITGLLQLLLKVVKTQPPVRSDPIPHVGEKFRVDTASRKLM